MQFRTDPLTGEATAMGGARVLRRAAIVFMLLAFSLGSTGSLAAEQGKPAAGKFTPAGSLAVARRLHTATDLPDGRLLIVGGMSVEGELASAEVWQPGER